MADPKQLARSGLKLRIKLGGNTIHHAGPGGSTRKRLLEVGYPAPDAQLEAVAAALRLCSQESLPSFPAWEELVAEVGITSAHATCSGGSQHDGGQGASMAGVQGKPPVKCARSNFALTAAVDSAPNDWQQEQAQSVPSRQTAASQKRNLSPNGAFEVCKRPRASTEEVQLLAIQQACALQGTVQPPLPAPGKAGAERGGCCIVKVDESALVGGGVLSSSSDQATTFGLYASLSTSPPEVSAQQAHPAAKQQDAAAVAVPVPLAGAASGHHSQSQQPTALLPVDRQQEPSHSQQQQKEQQAQKQLGLQASVQQQQAVEPTAPSKVQPNRCTVAMQTHEAVALLPPMLFPGLPLSAPSQPATATPLSQLTLPPHRCYMSVPSELADMAATEAQVASYTQQAVDKKRMADALRGGANSRTPWTPETLVLYVEAALLFMTAAECLLRMSARSRATRLCRQTADFLLFTLRYIEGAEASHLVRDCLRTLCERLAALCMLRENVASAHEFKECADRLDRLLADVKSTHGHSSRTSSHMNNDAGPAHGRPALNGPSPGIASSHDVHSKVSGSASAQAEIGRMQGRLVEAARLTARWSEFVRKSTLSFQSLTEKEETRSNEAASLACVHISAVSMCGGFLDGARAIAHAYQALACVKAL